MEEPTKMIEATERRWRPLTLANDFVFCKTMQDEKLCERVLEAILDVQIERVVYAGRQEGMLFREQVRGQPSAKAR